MIKSKAQKLIERAVGECCVSWSELEWDIVVLIHSLSRVISNEHKDQRVSFPLEMAIGHLELRDKISLAKVLAYYAASDNGIYDEISEILNHIDNDLRPERNRYIHDHWLEFRDIIHRVQHRPRIEKPQAFQLKLARRTYKEYPDPYLLFELRDKIDEAKKRLTELEEKTRTLPHLKELPSK